MRAAAVHLCFIDSGHLSLNRCQVMRHALSKQGLDKGAPVDLHRSGAAKSPVEGSAFACPKNEPPQLYERARVWFTRTGWQ